MIDLSPLAHEIGNRPVAVLGLGKSGLSSVRALRAAGIPVYVYDDAAEKIPPVLQEDVKPLSANGAELAACAFLIAAPGIPLHFPAPHPLIQIAREKNIPILGDIELFARARTGLTTVGITGTNGKSTTTALTAHILTEGGRTALACGNLGTPILDLSITDPDTVVVIEMSSFQLDLCPTFRPDIAIHLNLTPDHIDRHGTLENYIAAKARIFEGSGIGLCGVDDAYSVSIFEAACANPARRMIPVSCRQAMNNGLYLSGTEVADDVFEGGIIGSLSRLPTLRGTHNQKNALMAYGVARVLGLPPGTIFRAFDSYPGLPHRQISVRKIHGVEYINDSKATNADATEKALLTFHHMYWIVGGLPKEGGLSGLELQAHKIRHAYLIGTAADDFSAFMKKNNIPFTLSGTLETALAQAHAQAQQDRHNGLPPGVVLLSPACASYDQFKSYEHRGDVFTALVQALPAD